MYSSSSVPTLRQAARERGLDSRGGKKQLQKRLEIALEREVQQQQQQQQQLPAPVPVSNPASTHDELLITATPTPNPVTLVTSFAPSTPTPTNTPTPTPTPDFIHITTNDVDVGQSIPTPYASSPVLTSRITPMMQHIPPSLEGKIRITISLDGTAKQSFVLLTTSAASAQCKHNYTLLLATASNKFRCKVKRLFVASTGEELLATNLHTIFSAILAQGAAACKAVVTTGQTYVAPSAGIDSPDISKSVMIAAQASLVEGKIDGDGWPQSSIVQQLIAENSASTSYSSPPLSPTTNATNILSPLPTVSDTSATSTPLPTTCASSHISSANVYDVLSTLQRQSTSSPVAHHRILYSDATSGSPSTSPTLPSTPTTCMSRHHSFTDFSLVNNSQCVYAMLTTSTNSTTMSGSSTTSSDTTSTSTSTSTSTQSQRDMELLEKRCKKLEAEAKQAARAEKKLTEEVTKLTQLLAAARVFEDKYKECSSALAKSEQLIAKMTREKERLTYKNKTLATQNMTLKEQAAQHETTSQQHNKLQAQLDALTGADERHAVPKTAIELQYLLQIHSTGLARVHQQMSISLEQERRALRERKTCKICLDSALEILLLPCSHYVCCERCSNKITACPICRRHIEERKPVYM